MIRSKADAAAYIPKPNMGHAVQRIACLGWRISRYCQDVWFNGYRSTEAEVTDAIYRHRKAINDDIRRARRVDERDRRTAPRAAGVRAV